MKLPDTPTPMSPSLAPATQTAVPVVSVLIRTTGRSTLSDALASLARQTLQPIEIIAVDASAQKQTELQAMAQPYGVQLLQPQAPLSRSQAANALLEHAHSQYVLFLDDDDTLAADHLEKLFIALEAQPSLVAVYSDAQILTGPRDAPVAGHMFANEFDLERLQLENYLPIHSVLFRRSLVEQRPACRFDENLHLFEDWDFWLQLAQRGTFKRVPGVSAYYFMSDEAGSGHAQAQNTQRYTMLLQLAQRQLQRWNPAQVFALMQAQARQTDCINQVRQEADQLRHDNQLLHATLAQLSTALTAAQSTAASPSEALDVVCATLRRENAELQHQLQLQQQESRQALALLEQHNADLQHQMQSQQQELQLLAQLRVQLLQQAEQLNVRLMAVYRSKSWRWTWPLRAVLHAKAWVLNAQAGRLLLNTLRAVQAVVQRHGWRGFMQRLPHYLGHARHYLPLLATRAPSVQAADFHAEPPAPLDTRLSPDLTGGGATLDTKVSIVIPTLNAGPEFQLLLRKLRLQKAVREVEIVVVDSGSTDNTVLWARQADCKVVCILPTEFSHSYARNRGADEASGDYLLFMVQDAYPIGDNWLHGMLRYLWDHVDQKVVAASCAEYSRSDSDMMYDAMVNTHYRFLGCLAYDRIGEYQGDDHMALRSQGQLSDVSCLIARERFMQYHYRGDYAEDLDLGIRLIKDGYRVAMLASVKVIHSHNRPAYYYLKRTFVDVIFLVGLFDDFTYPRCESAQGLIAGVVSVAAHLTEWLCELERPARALSLGDEIGQWIQTSRHALDVLRLHDPVVLGDERLDRFIQTLAHDRLMPAPVLDAAAQAEARRFADSFVARLDHFRQFAAAVYGPQDALLRHELRDVVRKTYAAAAGGAIGFFYLDHQHATAPEHDMAMSFHQELKAGV